MAKTMTLEEFKDLLQIDRSDLESCLEDQGTIFWQLGEQQARATAERDAVKADIDELHAKLDKQIRHDAAVAEEKTTETGIANQIKSDVKMKNLQQAFLKAKETGDLWAAMDKAFQQRSYALRELVAYELKRLSLEEFKAGTERSINQLRAVKGDNAARKVEAGRREKLERRTARDRD